MVPIIFPFPPFFLTDETIIVEILDMQQLLFSLHKDYNEEYLAPFVVLQKYWILLRRKKGAQGLDDFNESRNICLRSKLHINQVKEKKSTFFFLFFNRYLARPRTAEVRNSWYTHLWLTSRVICFPRNMLYISWIYYRQIYRSYTLLPYPRRVRYGEFSFLSVQNLPYVSDFRKHNQPPTPWTCKRKKKSYISKSYPSEGFVAL